MNPDAIFGIGIIEFTTFNKNDVIELLELEVIYSMTLPINPNKGLNALRIAINIFFKKPICYNSKFIIEYKFWIANLTSNFKCSTTVDNMASKGLRVISYQVTRKVKAG